MALRPKREEFIIGQTYSMDFLDESEEGKAVEDMMIRKYGAIWILKDIICENDKIKYKFSCRKEYNEVFSFTTQTPEQSFIF